MNIKSLNLKNFRCFKNLSIKFENDITVLVAKNGQGKTTILDAIKIALWSYISRFDVYKQTNTKINISQDDVYCYSIDTRDNNSKLNTSLTITVSIDNKLISETICVENSNINSKVKNINISSALQQEAKNLQKNIYSADSLQENSMLPVLCYYGVGRHWNSETVQVEKRDIYRQSRIFGYHECLNQYSTFRYFLEWYRDIWKSYKDAQLIACEHKFDTTEQVKKRYLPIASIQTVTNYILQKYTEWKNIRYDISENSLILSNDNYDDLHVSQISDGIRNILGIITDIACRCIILNPHLKENSICGSTGIVLIDGIDMHLYPDWQQTILQDLHTIFPKIQFIVTTQSPQIVSSVERRNIRIINNGMVNYIQTSTYGAESQRVLEEVFGVSPRPQMSEAKHILDRYIKAIYNNAYDTDQAIADRKKLDEWLYGDPILDLADMLIRRSERKKSRE